MELGPLEAPQTDPAPIVELLRGSYGTELLVAACAHFNVFGLLAEKPRGFDELRQALGLEARPMHVLLTALRAMRLIDLQADGRFIPTPIARKHLVPDTTFEMGSYVGLMAAAPGVLAMVERLRTNRPAGFADEEAGTAYIYKEGEKSAMEEAFSARYLTLALAGRARNVAPALAAKMDLSGVKHLLDVGAGSGLYAIACLRQHPNLRASVWDRPEVLKVAAEMAERHGVADRLQLVPGDMFVDPVPDCDAVLLSNILHDWDIPKCEALLARCAEALPSGGRLFIHDVYLNDNLDGPLPIALYSAALFSLTEGRAYSAAEYRLMLTSASLAPGEILPTLVHGGVLTARKP